MTIDSGPEQANVSLARRLRRESLIIFGFIVLTAAMTWPWVTHLRDGVVDESDSYAHAYFLWWDYHQTIHDPRHLFNATIFFPERNTLAFGENDYGIALLFFPLFAIGLKPLTVFSVAAFLSFPFTGYGMFRLSRTLSAAAPLAWVAGITFMFLPYRFHHLSHLPLIFAGWIPLLVEALVLFVRERTWRRASWLGVVFVMNALTCVTWFILTLIPLGVSAVLLLTRQKAWRESALWLRAGISLTVAALVLLPFMLPFLQVAQIYGFVRSPGEVQAFSANIHSWLAVDEGNRLWKIFSAKALDYEMALFPGLALLAMAVLGFAASAWNMIRGRLSPDRVSNGRGATQRTELFIHASCWTVIGFLGSFGLNSSFHRFLYNYVPLFRSMRAAVRWSMICYVGLAMLAGLGALAAAEMLKRKWPRLPAPAVLSVLLLFVLFDQWVRPFPLVRGKVDADEVTRYLRAKTISGGIVELPAGDAGPYYMLRAADHGHPLVTARNSFVPPIELDIERLTTSKPIPNELLDLLEKIPTSYLVIHPFFMSPERRLETESFLNRAQSSGRLRFIRSFDSGLRNGLDQREDLYALVKIEPGTQTEGPLPPPVSRTGLEPLFNDRLAAFQNAGFFVYCLYKTSYGRLPRFAEFMPEMQTLKYDSAVGPDKFEAAKDAFVRAWVNRAEFQRQFVGLDDDRYVGALLANIGLTPVEGERDRLMAGLHDGHLTRSEVLKEVIANNAVTVREFNRAFVLLHYFTYLKRDPDEGGFQFWLFKLDRHNDYAGFTESFAASTERQIKLPQD